MDGESDMRRWLYASTVNAAALGFGTAFIQRWCWAKVKTVRSEITSSAFGDPLLGRLELVKGLHDCLTDDLAIGGSRFSANNMIGALRKFFQWVDQCERPLSIDTVAEEYLG